MDSRSPPPPRPFASHAQLAQLGTRIMSLSSMETDLDSLIPRIVLEVHRVSGFESVGLRLKDGEDFPYYFTQGFEQAFVEKEMFLCSRDPLGELLRDSEGNPRLECMCGNVIAGRTDASRAFFTPGGGFWTNGTSELLRTTTDADRQATTRNRCNGAGYETVALVPLKLGGVIDGLLQLNDRRHGALDPATMLLFEAIAVCIAMVCRLRQLRIDTERQQKDVRVGLTARAVLLERIAKELKARREEDRPIPESLLSTLGEMLDDLSRADGQVTMCAVCKRVREDAGWSTVERFVADRSHLWFSHGFCPDCYEKALEELNRQMA